MGFMNLFRRSKPPGLSVERNMYNTSRQVLVTEAHDALAQHTQALRKILWAADLDQTLTDGIGKQCGWCQAALDEFEALADEKPMSARIRLANFDDASAANDDSSRPTYAQALKTSQALFRYLCREQVAGVP